MLHRNSARTPVWASALCLILATGLTGCASKNPLMQEPAAATAASTATPTPSKPDVNSAALSPPANAGVEHSKSRGFFSFLKPYKIDVHQGNFVSQEMLAQLKEGMTQDQVRFVLGTPLLTDIFHSDRWDYIFRLQKGKGEVLTSRVTVFFKENRLQRFDGGNLPTEEDFLTLIVNTPPAKK